MEVEQEEFQENLTNLAGTVEGFASYDKMEKYLENAEAVESINQRLQECIEKSRIYNQREYLVGKETTDYSQLQQIAKDFLPYSNLWLTTRTWHERHKEWTEGKWEDLDPEELDTTFEHCMKTMNQAARYFKDRDFPNITENAAMMKEKIDDFRKVVPVAIALRKKGMKERHWEALSKETGIEIKPEEGFCLNTVIEKGMVEHADVCEDIGEKAYKEFNIEKSLKKMKDDWEGLDFNLPQFKQTTTSYITGYDDAIQILDEHIVMTQAF
jgi:dynein heavy chain